MTSPGITANAQRETKGRLSVGSADASRLLPRRCAMTLGSAQKPTAVEEVSTSNHFGIGVVA
jgi:hypothetical protein